MKLDTESKMSFDRSIGTEERFALRRWFDSLVETQNNHNLEEFGALLSDALVVDGFTDIHLRKQSYLDFLKPVIFENKTATVRYPNISFSCKGYLYHVRGDFEIYIDGILSCEGEIEIELVKNDEAYMVARKTFSPRMMMAFNL